ncbi:MAG: excinuclease ABC subunit UvrC [Pseudomonadales bacterium]|nr:excinuclease ABC subunit UvrC [Pseudomonadales bacterium]
MSADPDTTTFDSKTFLARQTEMPGVYQMFDIKGGLLYVGKAVNLKKRLGSYFRKTGLSPKTRAMVKRIHRIEVTVTHTETEALLLEQNLIKSEKPPYNILLRDDKSYPYIFVSTGDAFPRLAYHRGGKQKKGRYFGPYPNSQAVRESLAFLQKTFQVRQCEDSFFRNRSRPCLQYQIKRCTAPCVGFIDRESYAADVTDILLFLEGKEHQLTKLLADRMESASNRLDFETAAMLRDRLAALRRVQEQQHIEGEKGEMDIMAVAIEGGKACVHVLFVRQGRVLGSRSYFPELQLETSEKEVLSAFIPQFYLSQHQREIPAEIILSHDLEDELSLLQSVLAAQASRKVSLSSRVRSHRQQWCLLARNTAAQNLKNHLANKQNIRQRLDALQQALDLNETPQRIECFDISHSSGEATVASCVVFDSEGPVKSDYRRFNIEGVTAGDDYAAMAQALERRYTRLQQGQGKLPDILLIDGGKGQLAMAEKVLLELQIESVLVVGVAKGTTRKAGFETLIRSDSHHQFTLSSGSAALHLIQQIRDEAHRFAISGHKMRRDKKRRVSTLEAIPGVGPARRRQLLRYFGGQQEIARASIKELCRVEGVSQKLAQEIYHAFHAK